MVNKKGVAPLVVLVFVVLAIAVIGYFYVNNGEDVGEGLGSLFQEGLGPGGGGGGYGANSCETHDDCDLDPLIVCKKEVGQENGVCVECLNDDICGDDGPVEDHLKYCSDINTCVGCTDASHCKEGFICSGFQCVFDPPICDPDQNYNDGSMRNDECNVFPYCTDGRCSECLVDDHCPMIDRYTDTYCLLAGNTVQGLLDYNICVFCFEDDHCPSEEGNRFCNLLSYECEFLDVY